MYVSNFNNGIKILDLIDENSNQEDLYTKVKNWLAPIKHYFFIDDDVIWNDFIERFTDKFYSRYLNFDTYYEFRLKLKLLFENNKIKYQHIYKAQLIEIEPLINMYQKTKSKDNTVTKSVDSGIDSTTGSVESLTNNKSNSETKTKTNDVSTNSNSDTPQSNINVVDILSGDTKYINNINQTKNVNDDIVTDSNSSDGSVVTSNSNSVLYGKTNDGTTDLTHELTTEIINGNQSELLRQFAEIYIDVLHIIIDDIESEKLFSSIFYF